MNERWKRPAVVAGVAIVLASWAYIPATWPALNAFDPPKRFVWSITALVLAFTGTSRAMAVPGAVPWPALGLLLWLTARTGLRSNPTVELEVLFTWLQPLLLFVVVLAARRGGSMRWLGASLFVAGLIQAGLMLLQRFGFDPLFPEVTSAIEYEPGRMVGSIGFQNQAVDFLALSAAGLFLLTRSMRVRVSALALLFAVAALTANRGGILAFLSAAVVALAVTVAQRTTWSPQKARATCGALVAGALAVLALLAWIPGTGERFREMVAKPSQSAAITSRLHMIHVGLDMWRERPWLGWGAGAYAFQYLDRLASQLPEEKTHPLLQSVVFAREAHNDPLQFAAEFGMVGIVLVLLLAVSGVRDARARPPPPESTAALAHVLTYMGVSGLASFPWQTSMAGPLAGLILGFLWPSPAVARSSPVPGEGQASRRWRFTLGASLAVALAVASTAWFATDAVLTVSIPRSLASGEAADTDAYVPPFSHRYQALVGAAYAASGDNPNAERTLWRAHAGYRDIPLLNNLGHVLARSQQWHRACDVYTRWAATGLDHQHALQNLSIACEQAHQWEPAADALRRELKLWPSPGLPPQTIERLAMLEFRAGAALNARTTLEYYASTWRAADPATVARFENLLGAIARNLGDREQARVHFRAALALKPDLESAHRNLDALDRTPPAQPR